MRKMVLAALCGIAFAANAHAAVKEEPVTYQDGGTTMKGFVVYDDAVQGKRPGRNQSVIGRQRAGLIG